MKEVLDKSFYELSNLIKNKEIKPSEVCQAYLERISKVEDKINAYTYVNENLINEAKEKDEKLAKLSKDEIPELFGLPIAIKDNICVSDMPMTCSSRILEKFISPYDATVIRRIKEKGALILGKTNLDEFAFGSSTETSYFGPTKNPWDLERVPGGSSGGSAAAVAAKEAPIALGSDTGGSIRQPASFCGVVGLKPTYGRVSRYGLTAFASSLDQIGPLSKNVKDTAFLLEIISGLDNKDSTSVDKPVENYLEALENDIKAIKIGFDESILEDIDEDVKVNFFETLKILEKLGAEIIPITLKHIKYAVPTYYIIAPAEASSNLARFDGVRYTYRAKNYKDLIDMYMKTRMEGFGKEVKRRCLIGTYVLSAGYYDAYYLKAQKVRRLIFEDFEKAFKNVDLIATPTSPTPAFKLGERINDPIKMYLSDIFTIPANLAGLPAISVPSGFSKEKLPLGFQFIGKPFDESTLLNVSYQLEKALNLNLEPNF